MMLGLRRPTPGKKSLRLSKYLQGAAVPEHPESVDYFTGTSFGLYMNDRFGVCGPTAVANYRRLITRRLGGTMDAPSQSDVFDLYRRSGNENFDPNTGADDNGVNMQTMLEALYKGGIGGVKSLGHAKVDVANVEELKAAGAIFGAVLFGVDLQQIQEPQTNTGIWDYVPSAPWGGHAVLGGGKYKPAAVDVITWAKDVMMTPRFIQHQAMEAWVVLWPEHLGSKMFMEGMNLASFAADFEAITGRKFPATVKPAPTPAKTRVEVQVRLNGNDADVYSGELSKKG